MDLNRMCDEVFPGISAHFSVYTEHTVWHDTITASQNKCGLMYNSFFFEEWGFIMGMATRCEK